MDGVSTTNRPKSWLSRFRAAVGAIVSAVDEARALKADFDANGGVAWVNPVVDEAQADVDFPKADFLAAATSLGNLLNDVDTAAQVEDFRKVK